MDDKEKTRIEFAKAALTGLLANSNMEVIKSFGNDKNVNLRVAATAFAMADGMMYIMESNSNTLDFDK